MPTSDLEQIPTVLRAVISSRAESLLDVGTGFGKWGALCREYLEISRGRIPAAWRTQIDGIEAFESYRNRMWGAYDKVYVGDAETVLDELGSYDVVLCCDVLEHFNKTRGRSVLEKMLKHGKVVIITSPVGESPQGAEYGNAFEEHRSAWAVGDFAKYPHKFTSLGATFLVALSHDEGSIARIDIRSPDDRIGFRRMFAKAVALGARRVRERLAR